MNYRSRSVRMLLILYIVSAIVFYSCSKNDGPTNPPPNPVVVQDTVRPIVFVHGRLAAADAWTYMVQYFRLNKYPRNYLHAMDLLNMYSSSFTSYDIPGMAAQLETFVNSITQQTGWSRVDIAAHDIGAQVVQYYLTKKNGIDKTAHFISFGAVFDNTLTLNGSLTPSPVKYKTVRSDGNDATQNGNLDYGLLPNADNQQLGGLDHQRLLSHENGFKQAYSFFTGTQPTTTQFPLTVLNTISGKVINFFDNTPVAGAKVTLYNVDKSTGSRAIGGPPPVTTDAEGNWGPIEWDHAKMMEIYVNLTNYHDMHCYRQEYRDSSFTERVRMLPKSGGSALLQSFVSALPVSDKYATVILFSPNRALVNISVSASVNNVNVLNAQTAPLPGTSTTSGNTCFIVCFDENGDGANGSGPMANPLLTSFGLSSFDVFMQASSAGQTIPTKINTTTINARNWKSSGTPNNTGISIVQYDNWF